MKIKSLLAYISILFVVVLASCDDYDKWTVSPNARLVFSSDTLSFDTVITSQSSPTRQLLVWNKNSEGLRISRVELGKGSNSLFRVNVDGQFLYGGVGEDFEIRRKDSIFVKLEVCLPEEDSDELKRYEDVLRFTLESGLVQEVRLIADGQNVRVLEGLVVDENMTLSPGRPYLVRDSMVVREGACLTLQPGVCLMFHDNVSLRVEGTLDAQGTLDSPIIFRGDRLDRLFPYLPYDNTTNRWGGIIFTPTSRRNVMTQCDVHSGTFGIRCDSTMHINDHDPVLRLVDCIIHNVGGDGLSMVQTNVEVVGTQISNTLGHTVSQLGGNAIFVHCTIAQYYPFTADRGDALHLSNLSQEIDYPLLGSKFYNCVITGYADDVIMGDLSNNGDTELPYYFESCLLRTPAVEDEHFVSNIFDSKEIEPNGQEHFALFDSYSFLYDFTPVEESILRHHANTSYTQSYSPIDRRGVDRLTGDGPDIGAYQCVTNTPKE